MIRIGCSGWNYASWRETFYAKSVPASRWLEYYAGVFDTVEVNTTFYRLAKREAVARWAGQTPPEFCFAVKASRYLTHIKRLKEMDTGVQRLIEPLQPLAGAGKLGVMLWQLPANFHRDLVPAGLRARAPAGRTSHLRVSPRLVVLRGGLLAAARARRGAGDRRPP